MSDPELPEHVRRNRAYWDVEAANYVAAGHRNWAKTEPTWGVFGVPERDLGVLPDVDGTDVIELGCGTAYISAWLARRGARPVGIDNSERQLETARALQLEHGLEFLLIHGNAESVPLPDASFDLAISEYGASIWADPYRWVPEAARLLRPGGRLTFLVNGTFWILCVPDEWPDDPGVEFHLGYGDWVRLLRANGFEVEDLIEVRPAAAATTNWESITLEWARRWPVEEIWKARKLG